MNKNIWLVRRTRYLLPAGLNDDYEVEYDYIPGWQIPSLLDYWRWMLRNGHISVASYRLTVAEIAHAVTGGDS